MSNPYQPANQNQNYQPYNYNAQQQQYPQQQYPQQAYPQQQYSQQQYPQQQYQQQQYPQQQYQQPYQQAQQPVQQYQSPISYQPSGTQNNNVSPSEEYQKGLGEFNIHESLLSGADFSQRKKFIVKVYTLLSIQLFVTFGFVLIAYLNYNFRKLMINPVTLQATPLYWVCFAISLITEIAIFCCKNVARKVPTNYIALTIFTVTFSFVVAGSCAVCYDAFSNGGELVLCAALMTFAVTVALTIYAFTTKTDFTMKGGALFICAAILFVLSIFCFIFPSIILMLVICSLSIVLYGFYLIYDTQLIVGGKSHQLNIDDYVIGTMFIYIDIIIMFLRLLQILMILFGKK